MVISNIYFYMGGSAPHAPRLAGGPTPTPATYVSQNKSSFNPLLHFVKPEIHLISSDNLRFSASRGPLGVRTPPANWCSNLAGGFGGTP